MSKYLKIFSLTLSNILVYRLNFIIGRFRGIIILLLLYSLWSEISHETGAFADYSAAELFTYIFGAHLLRGFIFGDQSRQIAIEINDGSFSRHLIKPTNHPLFFYWRELAERLVATGSALMEVSIAIAIFRPTLIIEKNPITLLCVAASIILAHGLYYALSYCVNLLAFWSREAMGPRFLFEWFLEFASGAYFPLNIVSPLIFTFLQALPFFYLLFAPLSIYLGHLPFLSIIQILFIQIIWLTLTILLSIFLWYRGLRQYSAEGI